MKRQEKFSKKYEDKQGKRSSSIKVGPIVLMGQHALSAYSENTLY